MPGPLDGLLPHRAPGPAGAPAQQRLVELAHRRVRRQPVRGGVEVAGVGVPEVRDPVRHAVSSPGSGAGPPDQSTRRLALPASVRGTVPAGSTTTSAWMP